MGSNDVPKFTERRVSTAAGALYTSIGDSLTDADEDKQARCVLSMSTPADLDEYFKWFFVPSGRGTSQSYTLADFDEYVKRYNVLQAIPDPIRKFANLRFMMCRLQRQLLLTEQVMKIRSSEVTDDLRNKILHETFGIKETASTDTTKDLGILCGLTSMDKLNLVHKTFNTYQDANRFLVERKTTVDEYLVRISTKANPLGTGDCTVFTVSFMVPTYDADQQSTYIPYNIRFVDIHGVGVYPTTGSPDSAMPWFNLNVTGVMQRADMSEILKLLGYAPPPYACIIDCLRDMDARKYIKLNRIIPVL